MMQPETIMLLVKRTATILILASSVISSLYHKGENVTERNLEIATLLRQRIWQHNINVHRMVSLSLPACEA